METQVHVRGGNRDSLIYSLLRGCGDAVRLQKTPLLLRVWSQKTNDFFMKVERTILVVSKVSVLAPHRMHGERPMHVVAKRPVGRPHTLHSGFQQPGCSKERTLITWTALTGWSPQGLGGG